MLKTALVTGAASGLGRALVVQLKLHGYYVMEFDIAYGHDVRAPRASQIPEELDVLVNCAGINRIGWLAEFPADDWDAVLDTNAKGIFLMAQACLGALKKRSGTILNIVSNAAHMPMRCSAAYNASKGAALILTRQLARELAPDITVFSVSPNKLSGTEMSRDIDVQVQATRGWSAEQAREYQLAGLLTHEETPVEAVADFIGYLLQDKAHHKFLAGCDLPYGA